MMSRVSGIIVRLLVVVGVVVSVHSAARILFNTVYLPRGGDQPDNILSWPNVDFIEAVAVHIIGALLVAVLYMLVCGVYVVIRWIIYGDSR